MEDKSYPDWKVEEPIEDKRIIKLNKFRETLKEVQRQRWKLKKRLARKNKRIQRLRKEIKTLEQLLFNLKG